MSEKAETGVRLPQTQESGRKWAVLKGGWNREEMQSHLKPLEGTSLLTP